MDDFVDVSGSIIRRLQRVAETENRCLPICPYLQHYVNCPLSGNTPLSPISESEEEDSTCKPELLVKKRTREWGLKARVYL